MYIEGLRHEANQAARQLTIPLDQLTGREYRNVYSVDSADTQIRDDAFAADYNSEAGYALHACAADIASFIAPGSTLQRYAQMRFEQGRSSGSFPDEVRAKMGLSKNKKRPALTVHIPIDKSGAGDATVSREIVRLKKAASPQEIPEILARENGRGAFTKLHHAATLLGAASANAFTQTILEITQRKMAAYMGVHAIPGIFRLVTPPTVFPQRSRVSDRPETQGQFTDIRASIQSPLWKYSDYVNQLNVVAHLEDRSFPFPPGRLAGILQYIIKRETPPPPPAAADIKSQLKRARGAYNKSGSDRFPKELESLLSQALFSSLQGQDREVRALRQSAARLLETNSVATSNVINIAKTKGWIQITPDPDAGGQILVTHDRQVFAYPDLTEDMEHNRAEKMRLITEIADA